MSPLVSTYLMPNSTAVKFAIKTTLAMMLALYVAFPPGRSGLTLNAPIGR